jgi:hypothetical protein
MAWFSRLLGLFRNDELARDQVEELQFHLAMRELWNVEHGLKRARWLASAMLRRSSWREGWGCCRLVRAIKSLPA